MASYTEKFKLFKYNPTTDGESSFSINQALNENWDKIDEAIANVCGLSIGDIGISLYVDESSGLRRRLNGTTVSINNNTRAFYNYLKNLQGLHPELFTTETNWQSEVTLSDLGQCGKFVIDEAGGTIRLPKVVNIQGVMDMAQCGMTVKAGLPNITGTSWIFSWGGKVQSTGAFTNTQNPQGQIGSKNAEVYSGIERFDASLANPIYGNSETVQQEAIQYPFFIQIATGVEIENKIENEIRLNNPFTLLECKYSENKLYNASWLLSDGTYYSKSVYLTAYEALIVEENSEIEIGSVQELSAGVKYIKRGLSVKTTSNEFTDYDFVLNKSNETFRFPNKVKLAGGKMVVGTGLALGLSNGTKNFSLRISNTNSTYGSTGPYGQPFNTVEHGDDYPNTAFGITLEPENSGMEVSDEGVYLYFYVGETVQNANLIDAGRLQEQITEINARPYIKETYDDGVQNGYRIYSNGYCEQWGFSAGLSGSSVGMRTINTYKTYRNEFYYRVGTYKFEETSWNSVTNSSPSLSNTANVVPFLCLATPNSFQVGRTVPLLWFTAGFLAKGEY